MTHARQADPRPATGRPSGPARWRTTRCEECGALIETTQQGDRTLCDCDTAQ